MTVRKCSLASRHMISETEVRQKHTAIWCENHNKSINPYGVHLHRAWSTHTYVPLDVICFVLVFYSCLHANEADQVSRTMGRMNWVVFCADSPSWWSLVSLAHDSAVRERSNGCSDLKTRHSHSNQFANGYRSSITDISGQRMKAAFSTHAYSI